MWHIQRRQPLHWRIQNGDRIYRRYPARFQLIVRSFCLTPLLVFLMFDNNGLIAPTSTDDTSLCNLSLIHISEPTRLLSISYAVFCLKKKKKKHYNKLNI